MTFSFKSRGGDPNLESFYTTEYSSNYTRPQTTATRARSGNLSSSVRSRSIPIEEDTGYPGETEYQARYRPPQTAVGTRSLTQTDLPPQTGSGYATNHHVSPLALNELDERSIYRTSVSHLTHSKDSTVEVFNRPRTVPKAAMERSGFWREPLPNTLYDSPEVRRTRAVEEAENAKHLHPQTLKTMRHNNPINVENGGAGPAWGSTTSGTAYVRHPTPQEAFYQTDRSLIGKREANGFTRQHITVHQENIEDPASEYSTSFGPRPKERSLKIPGRTVMDTSGFAKAAIATHSRNTPLSDVGPDDLHAIEVERLRKKNTPEYQSLFEPSPYVSTAHLSYQNPHVMSRASTATTRIRHGPTGYQENSTIIAGAPGDPATHKTGKTEYRKKFVDQQLGFRGRPSQTANVVERSGFWSSK